jgi:hypothetical protein
MKNLLTTLAIISFATAAPTQAEDNNIIAFPTIEKASFLIEVPPTWELTQAESEEDFFHLDGPTGAIFSFRTIEGTEETLKEAIDDTLSHVGSLFTDIELSDAQDWQPNGLTGFYATGSGKSADNEPVSIGVAWCALPDGKIAQVWFVSDANDAAGMREAEFIANSLQAPQE